MTETKEEYPERCKIMECVKHGKTWHYLERRKIKMSYNYKIRRPFVFTEEGQEMFLKIRDEAKRLLDIAGAFNMKHVLKAAGSGNSWDMFACVDRLVELKEITPLNEGKTWHQYTVYYDGKTHNR